MRAPRVALSRELPQDRKVARVSGLWRVREGFLLPFCDLCRRRPGQPARPGCLGVDRGGRITLGGSAAALLRRACVLGISKAFRVQL